MTEKSYSFTFDEGAKAAAPAEPKKQVKVVNYALDIDILDDRVVFIVSDIMNMNNVKFKQVIARRKVSDATLDNIFRYYKKNEMSFFSKQIEEIGKIVEENAKRI